MSIASNHMGPTLEQLITNIAGLRQESAGGRFFVKTRFLRPLLPRPIILETLRESSVLQALIPSLANYISSSGIIIFAILIWLRSPDSIVSFKDNGEGDSRLPMSTERLLLVAPDALQFSETQWDFLPHFFEKGANSVIQDRVILPFLEEIHLPELEGSSGAISKVTIEPTLHNLVGEEMKSDAVFMRKRIKLRSQLDKTKVDFRREKECLQLLQLIDHPNIVKFLCSYSYRSEDGFLFPCLAMDLKHFLGRTERFALFAEDRTFYQALQGLASALDCVHNFKVRREYHEVDLARIGYHHDIRPANILVTSHTFMLADFGLSNMKPSEQGSQTDWKIGGGDYIAPECRDGDFREQAVGRAIDIWAFGCMIVDIATYMLRGARGVQEAMDNRSCVASPIWNVRNSYFWLNDSIRPQVACHMDELQDAGGGSDGKASGLIDAARLMLQMQPKARPTSCVVWHTISYLATKKLYGEAIISLQNYFEFLQSQGDNGPPTLNVWFEIERLNLWGTILDLNDRELAPQSTIDTMGSDGLSRAQNFLIQIEKLGTDTLRHRHEESKSVEDTLKASFDLYSQLHEELRKLVVGLCELLPAVTQKRLDLMWQARLINTNDLSALNARAKVPKEIGQGQYEEVAALASMRSLQVALTQLSETDEKVGLLCLDERQLERTRMIGDHEIGWLCQRPDVADAEYSQRTMVLIERVYYTSLWTTRPPAERAKRIGALAKLLNEEPKPCDFRVLHCMGYVGLSESEEAYSFIYAFPKNRGSDLVPETLLSLLRKSVQNKGKQRQGTTERPPLEKRVQLAQALTRSLYAFHAIGWLHKALNSNNILFFSPPSEFGAPNLSEPYIVNFRLSRPDGQLLFTDGPDREMSFVDYQHPAYIAQLMNPENDGKTGSFHPFRKAYDYYSIGIVLLEIGCWDSIQSFTKLHPTEKPAKFRDILITRYVPRLDLSMGRVYRDVTMACLKGDFLEDEDDGAAETSITHLSSFFMTVIEPLSKIYVG